MNTELLQKYEALSVQELLGEKLKKIRNLQKILQETSTLDVSKKTERLKLLKIYNQLKTESDQIELIDKVYVGRDF